MEEGADRIGVCSFKICEVGIGVSPSRESAAVPTNFSGEIASIRLGVCREARDMELLLLKLSPTGKRREDRRLLERPASFVDDDDGDDETA